MSSGCQKTLRETREVCCVCGIKMSSLQETFSGLGFLGVRGKWGEAEAPYFIFNIYSPCDLAGKKLM